MSAPTTIFTKKGDIRRCNQRGAATLLLVIVAAAILAAVAVAVAGQARHDIRMTTAEVQAAAAASTVSSVFEVVSAWIDYDTNQVSTLVTQTGDGSAWCTPDQTLPGTTYPKFCLQMLSRPGVWSEIYGEIDEYPVRVVWQASSGSSNQAAYGWIRVDPNGPYIMGVDYYHNWCTPNSVDAQYLHTCLMGG